MVIATQNPVTQRGTYYLPESQLDRFMMKLSIGYPERSDEVRIVKNMIAGVAVSQIQKIITLDELVCLKKQSQKVMIHDKLIEYAAESVDKTREHERIQLGASPRALIAWINAARAYAFIEGREYVTPDDLKFLAAFVLAHRIIPV